jgi:hypothetical protein
MPKSMYVAALAQPLSVEYLLLDPVAYDLAKEHPGGLFDFVRRSPALAERAPRFRSLAVLRRHCAENGTAIAGDLHGCPGSAAGRCSGAAPP